MMKFFRRYTKQLLAVFMALLLIVWLGGEALESFMRRDVDFGKQVQGTAYGETVRLRDMWPAFEDTEILDDIGLRFWRAPWVLVLEALKVQNPQQYAGEVRQSLLSREEWYMLDAAAQRAHVHVAPEAIESFKSRIGLTDDNLAKLRQRTRKTMEQVDQSLQRLLRVQEAALLAAQAVKVSEADVNDMIRQTGEKARITAVIVESKPFIDNTYEPTAEEIQAQFEKYRNVTSRPGETGYQLPAAAQIEVIGFEAQLLAPYQQIDEQEALAYWKQHPTEFMKPPATQPTTSTAPAEQPKPYTSFSEARPKVIAKLQSERAKSEAQRLARELIEKLQASWVKAGATRPAETAPAGEKDDLYARLAAEVNAKYPGVARARRFDLLSEEKIAREAVGSAIALQNSQQQMAVPQAAFLVREFAEITESGRLHPLYRGLHETAPQPFISPDGNVCILRTLDVRAAQAPDSSDTLREQIVQDIRRARARDEAEKAARALAEQAAQKGLEAAFNADEALKQKLTAAALKKPDPFAHKMLFAFWGPPQLYPGNIMGVGRNIELLDKIFDLAAGTATQPNKVTLVEEKSQERFVIAELLETLPVTRAEYNQQRASVLQVIETQKRIQALKEWFDPEQIRARVGWQDAAAPSAEKESESRS